LLTSVQLPKPTIEGLSPFKLQRFVKEPPLSTLDEQFAQSITVYPNPSLTGAYELQFAMPTKRINIIVRDVTGRLIKEEWVEHGVEKYTLDLQHLTQGLYVVEIEDGKRKAVKRIVKQ
ncbi:MAG: T9SS type A sorting domain-containing protein, partial [Thermoflexibacteraceae bacterium]